MRKYTRGATCKGEEGARKAAGCGLIGCTEKILIGLTLAQLSQGRCNKRS